MSAGRPAGAGWPAHLLSGVAGVGGAQVLRGLRLGLRLRGGGLGGRGVHVGGSCLRGRGDERGGRKAGEEGVADGHGVLAIAVLTAIPARISAGRPAAEVLRSELG
jgi:hypothetical protein